MARKGVGWGDARDSLDLTHCGIGVSSLVCSGFSEVSNSLYIEF